MVDKSTLLYNMIENEINYTNHLMERLEYLRIYEKENLNNNNYSMVIEEIKNLENKVKEEEKNYQELWKMLK